MREYRAETSRINKVGKKRVVFFFKVLSFA